MQRLTISAFSLFIRNKHHIGAFLNHFTVLISVPPPLLLFHSINYCLSQGFAHPRADCKSDLSFYSILTLLIVKPVDQLAFVTCRISSKAVFIDALRQTIKSYPRRSQWTHYRRHIPIPELINQYQPCLGPYTKHRLIALLSFIGHHRLALLALYDRRILIHRRFRFLGLPSPEFFHQIITRLPQSS